VPVEAN
jgi:hypothetical protein